MFQSLHFMCSAAKRRRGASRSGRAERRGWDEWKRNQKHNSWLWFLLRSPSKDSILSASLWTVMDGLWFFYFFFFPFSLSPFVLLCAACVPSESQQQHTVQNRWENRRKCGSTAVLYGQYLFWSPRFYTTSSRHSLYTNITGRNMTICTRSLSLSLSLCVCVCVYIGLSS